MEIKIHRRPIELAKNESLKPNLESKPKPFKAAKWLAGKDQVDLFYSQQEDMGVSWGHVAAGIGMVAGSVAATAATVAGSVYAANQGAANRAAGGKSFSSLASTVDLPESKIHEMNVSELLRLRENFYKREF